MGKRSLGSEFQGLFWDISGGGETLGQAETQRGGVQIPTRLTTSQPWWPSAGSMLTGTNDRLVAWVRVGVSGQEDLKSD